MMLAKGGIVGFPPDVKDRFPYEAARSDELLQ
jgi:hypothetical protein